MTKLAAVLVAISAATVAAPASAQACHRRGGVCGRVRVWVPPFGVRIGYPRAHIVIRGPILGYGIGDDAEPPPPPPPPPPVDEPPPPPEQSYAAPEPPPPPPPPLAAAPEPTTVYSVSRPREPNIGIGMRASTLHIGRNGPSAHSLGALLRFRSRPVELELEVGRDSYGDSTDRTDTRVGGSLIVPLTKGSLQPYVVAGTGMNFAYFGGTGDQLHQGYLSLGGGLALRLGRSFELAADARYLIRRFFDDEARVLSNDPNGVRDEAVELGLRGVLYF